VITGFAAQLRGLIKEGRKTRFTPPITLPPLPATPVGFAPVVRWPNFTEGFLPRRFARVGRPKAELLQALRAARTPGVIGGQLVVDKADGVAFLAMVRLLGSKARCPRSVPNFNFHGGGIGGRASNRTADQGKNRKANRDAKRAGSACKIKEVCQY